MTAALTANPFNYRPMAKLTHYWQEVLRRIPDFRPIIGVEVGVWEGRLGRKLLAARPQLTLYMVDPWQAEYREAKFNQADCDAARAKAEQLAAEFGERACIVPETSAVAVEVFEPQVDFFFLDAIHTEEAITEYLVEWLPKLKPGGWYGGRDFAERWFPQRVGTLREHATVGVDRSWFVDAACRSLGAHNMLRTLLIILAVCLCCSQSMARIAHLRKVRAATHRSQPQRCYPKKQTCCSTQPLQQITFKYRWSFRYY